MRKLPGGIFFAAAAVLLAVNKFPDIFTVAAVVACAAMAGLSATKHSHWSAIGGAALIAVSLTLQSLLSYRCADCIRADIIILAGVVCLSIAEDGRLKFALRVMAPVLAVMLAINAALHYPPGMVAGAVQADKIDRYITVSAGGREVILDTGKKPVLLFSPTCGACKKAVEKLTGLDPGGRNWVPVQVGGNLEEGKKYLLQEGYRGDSYQYKWSGPVPTMLTARDDSTLQIHDIVEMIGLVGGDGG